MATLAYRGDTVTFSVGAMGRMPLNYQWKFNGTNLDCATNALLVLTNVPLCAAGNSNCIVTNAFGTTTSSNATLTVLRSTPRFNNVACFPINGFCWQLDQLSGHGAIIILVS